jgi:hypothetical protein
MCPNVQRLERMAAGFGVMGAALAWRVFVVPPSTPVLVPLGGWIPPMKAVDLVIAPLALLGLVVLAGAPELSLARRTAGIAALAGSVMWPVLTLPAMSPVVMTLTASHGVHVHDVLVVPMLVTALTLLEPWRAPLVHRRPGYVSSRFADSVDPSSVVTVTV